MFVIVFVIVFVRWMVFILVVHVGEDGRMVKIYEDIYGEDIYCAIREGRIRQTLGKTIEREGKQSEKEDMF